MGLDETNNYNELIGGPLVGGLCTNLPSVLPDWGVKTNHGFPYIHLYRSLNGSLTSLPALAAFRSGKPPAAHLFFLFHLPFMLCPTRNRGWLLLSPNDVRIDGGLPRRCIWIISSWSDFIFIILFNEGWSIRVVGLATKQQKLTIDGFLIHRWT